MDEFTVTSGFLIEKTFARMYREFLGTGEEFQWRLHSAGYATPRRDVPPERGTKQYRGPQRDPLFNWVEPLRGHCVEPTDQELAAWLLMTELEDAGRACGNILFALEDARAVLGKIEPPVEREIVWTCCMDPRDEPPAGAVLLGYDPSPFHSSGCDSAIAEGMFFTYPGSHDEEGLRFKAHYDKLNRWGWVDTPSDAERYLKGYLSFLPADWDQHHCVYHIMEVTETVDSGRCG